MDVAKVAATLDAELARSGSPQRAEQARRYLKSREIHYGVSVPEIRRIAKTTFDSDTFDHDELTALLESLWARNAFECRMVTVEIANWQTRRLEPSDVGMLEQFLREAGTWALVDALAVHAVGQLLDRHRESDAILDRWATDENFWIRRSALLAHLASLRAGAGNWERFTRYADEMLEEKEFFIRKAIGWILRDTSRKRPDMVFAWIHPRAHRASGVTLREAVKKLSPHQAAAVMARRQ